MFGFRLTGKLWRHRDFVKLWFSDTVSQVGNQFTTVALPLIAAKIFLVNPFQLGILGAFGFLPFPTLGLFVGVWADRFRKRRIMTICNFGRMATLGTIPSTFFFAHPLFSLYQLYAVSLANGIFTVFFDVSYQSYLPILIDRGDLLEGNSKLQVSASGAQLVGPTIGGVAYSVFGGAASIAVDALGYLASAISLASIKKKEANKEAREKGDMSGAAQKTSSTSSSFFSEMKEGIHIVFDSRMLRSIAACTATSNLGSYIASPALILFVAGPSYVRFGGFQYGAWNSVGAAGFLVGVLITGSITRKLGVGPTLALAIGSGMAGVLYVFAPLDNQYAAFAFLAAVSVVVSLAIAPYNINQVSLRQAITPDRLQGRMNATMRTLVWGTIPVGALIGGFLGDPDVLGIINTIVVGSLVAGIACVWIVFSPVFKLRELPKPTTSDRPAGQPFKP